jgi:glutaredoxin
VCPNCEELKSILDKNGILYDTKDLEDDDVKIELLMDCVTLIDAPIIKIDDKYYNKDDTLTEMSLC